MMKILLINPPIEDFYQTEIRQEPLGLEYLAAVLRQQGHQVKILDALASGKKRVIPLPPQLAYLQQFYPPDDLSPFKLFTRYRHFGLDFTEIRDEIIRFVPDLIGISANFTPYFDMALGVARVCKSVFPNVPVVMGGHHVTAEPEDTLRKGCGVVDYLVLGEGEVTLGELIKALEASDISQLRHLAGIAFRNENQLRVNPPISFIEDLDALPFPVPEIPAKFKMILTSRGCPRRCSFCAIAKVMGYRWRRRSIESVIEEIRFAVQHGFDQIDFEDDNLTWDRQRAKELFRALIKDFKGQSKKVTFSAMNGLDTESLDEELIVLMAEAGFQWLNLPLVSSDSHVQRQIHRCQSQEKFVQVVNIAARNGLKVVAYLILGLPGDHVEQMLRDLVFLSELPVLLGPSIFYPPPGSAIYQYCLEQGYIRHGEYILLRGTAFPVETPAFQRRDLVTLLRLVRVINFIKYLADQISEHEMLFQKYLASHLSRGHETLIFDHKLSRLEIGFILLNSLFALDKGKLRGLRLKSKTQSYYQYEWLSYVINDEIVEKFLQLLDGKRIKDVEGKAEFRF